MVQFRKSKKAGPFRFTLSQRGLSTGFGGGPFRVGYGADRRIRRTIRIPGTGIYDVKTVGGSGRRRRSAGHPILVLLLLLFIFFLAIAYWKVTLGIAIIIAIAWGAYMLIRSKQGRPPTSMSPSPQTSGSGQGKSTERVLHEYLVTKFEANEAKETPEGEAVQPMPPIATPKEAGFWESFRRSFSGSFRRSI